MENRQAVGGKLGVWRQNLRPVYRRVHGMHNRGSAQKGLTQTADPSHVSVGIGLICNVFNLVEFVPDHQVIADMKPAG